MTASIQARILDALVIALQGTPGVQTLITDSARMMTLPDGMTVSIDFDGTATDQISKTCEVITSLPVTVTIYSTREPEGPPNWQLLDPVYVEIHKRIMSDRRLGGLAYDIISESRTPDATIKACALACRYTVKYATRQEDASLQ